MSSQQQVFNIMGLEYQQMIKQSQKTRGFGLIEVLVSVGIIGAILVGLVGAFQLFLSIGLSSTETIKAVYLLEEGLEAVRSTRDGGWASEIETLTVDIPYYLFFSGGEWLLSTTPSLIDGVFDRTVELSSVSRDSNGAIVTTGGSNDEGSREVLVSVSWLRRGTTTTREATTYITNFFE